MSSAERTCYDVAFGLGSACSCTQTLRTAGLQYASFPCDWLLGSDLVERTRLLLNGFDGAFEAGDFEEIPNPGAFRHASYRNRRTGLFHFHDFDQGVRLGEQLASVREKYVRRCERLFGLLDKAQRALVVWIGDPRDKVRVPEANIAASLALLKEKFPKVQFRFLVFDCVAGLAPANAERSEASEIFRVAFDYRRPNAEKEWEICGEWLLPYLATCSVTDYRSPEQKKDHARRERERERARFPAKTVLGYWLTKLEFKVWHHLKKSLMRRGIDL